MTKSTTPLVAAIGGAGYRVTEPRRAVAEIIAAREGHFTAADLVRESRQRRLGIGRATIFRALDLLLEIGVVERLDLPNGDHAYVGCEPRHHHHVVCSRCGRSAEVGDLGLEAVFGDVATSTGFIIDTHRLELFGLCPTCQTLADG